jgi:hypothetical protein
MYVCVCAIDTYFEVATVFPQTNLPKFFYGKVDLPHWNLPSDNLTVSTVMLDDGKNGLW